MLRYQVVLVDFVKLDYKKHAHYWCMFLLHVYLL